MGGRRGAYMVLVGNLREKDHLEDVDLDGMMTLSWIYKQWDGWRGLD
jgi:hypothetical protein